jgi:hypothetical protein
MGFRFRKSLKIVPGVRLNLSKSGTSWSIGGKGFTTNISKRGVRQTASLLGTGLSYSTFSSFKSRPTPRAKLPSPGGVLAGLDAVHVAIDEAGKVTFSDRSGSPLTASQQRIFKRDYAEQIEALQRQYVEQTASPDALIRSLPDRFPSVPCRADIEMMLEPRSFPAFDKDRCYREDTVRLRAKSKPGTSLAIGCLSGPALFVTGIFLSGHGFPNLGAAFGLSGLLASVIGFFAGIGSYFTARRALPDVLAANDYFRNQTEWLDAETEFQKAETERIRELRRVLTGDKDLAESLLDEAFGEVAFPYPFSVAYELGDDALFLDLDLPEIEDTPGKTASLKSDGKIAVRKKTKKEQQEFYARLCHGMVFWFGALCLSRLIQYDRVFISGFTQRIDRKDGHQKDVYVLAVAFDRETMASMNLARIEPIDAVEAFEHRRAMGTDHSLKPIEPFRAS